MITVAVLLIPLVLFLIIFFIFSAFNIYHVFRFGFGDIPLFFATFGYIALSVITIFVSFQLLSQVDWSTPIIDLNPGPGAIPGFNDR